MFHYIITTSGQSGYREDRVSFMTADAIERNFRIGMVIADSNGNQSRITAIRPR